MSISELVEELCGVDVSTLERKGVLAGLSLLASVKAWHDGMHIQYIRRLQALAESSPSMFPEADIAAASNTSRRDASAATRRVIVLDAVPEMETALTAGSVSTEHIDSLGRALKRLSGPSRDALAGDGARLARLASGSTPEEFDKTMSVEVARLDAREGGERLQKQRRDARFRSWTDRQSGMVCFRGELDPESGVKVLAKIDAAVEALFHGGLPDTCPDDVDARQDHLRALAVTKLILRRKTSKSAPSSGSAVAATVHLDSDDADANHGDSDNATGDANHDADHDHDSDHDTDHDTDTDHDSDHDSDDANNGDGDSDGDDLDLDQFDNRTEMIVVIDLETLISGLHEESILTNGHGVDLPLESYRRMACQAAIIPVVLDSNGVCLDEGRKVRLATHRQRLGLIAMYDTCGVDDCRVGVRRCQPHHVDWWEHGGPTDLKKLLPLCNRHHHAVHEGGWQLELHPDRSLTIAYPDGTIRTTGPPGSTRRKAA